MAWRAVQLSVFLPFSQTSAITKAIVRPTYVQEALGHQLKESNGPRWNTQDILFSKRLAQLNVDCLTGGRTEGNRLSQSDSGDSLPCTLQTHLLLTQRAHTHIICFPNTPTHTFAHRAARHWVFLNTVLLGSLLYNQCLRDIQRLSHLFNVTMGNFCPHPGTTPYCPSTGRKHACGENISLYLHCTL